MGITTIDQRPSHGPVPDPAGHETLHALFEAQARRVPRRPAVVFGDRTLSYAELETAANRLASRLRACGVGPDTPVGVCVDRGPELVVALLGILKAGGAYLPLDPDVPQARARVMLATAGAGVCVTQRSLAGRLPTGRFVLRLVSPT